MNVRRASPTPCRSCGQEGYEIDWIPERTEKLLALGVCFECCFWLEVVEQKERHCIIKGWAFRPKADDPEFRAVTGGWGMGGGGTESRIVFADGTLMRCCNLWHRGEVPPIFRDRLPDDARFATPSEWENLASSSAASHIPQESV